MVLVNAGLVYAALYSFPGKAGDEGFDLSNHYDAVLERGQREAALGWTVDNADGCGGQAGGELYRPRRFAAARCVSGGIRASVRSAHPRDAR